MPLFHTHEIALRRNNIDIRRRGVMARVHFGNLGRKLDFAQLAMDTQAWQDVQRYMPISSGQLISETNVLNATVLGSGKVYVYPPNSAYGHYQHEGIVYKDPVYNVGGFYNTQTGQWWSRRGISKVPSTQLLTYSQPNAHRYWGQYAIDHHKDEWIRVFKRAMRS